MDARNGQYDEDSTLKTLQDLITATMGKPPRLAPYFNARGELICNLGNGTMGLNDLLYEMLNADPLIFLRELEGNRNVETFIQDLINLQIQNKQLFEKYDILLGDLHGYIFNKEWKYINFLGYEYSIALVRNYYSTSLPPCVKKQWDEITAYLNNSDDLQENPYKIFSRIKNIALSPQAKEDVKYWSDDLKYYYDAFTIQPDEDIFPNTLPEALKTSVKKGV